MGLKQATTFKGLPANESYLKITQVVIFEKIDNRGLPDIDKEGNKLYSANITYTRFDSEAKENELERTTFLITNLSESEFSYNKFYNKTKNNYTNAIDAL